MDLIVTHAGNHINSGYELGRILIKAAPLTQSIEAYVEATRAVNSSYERGRALKAILNRADLNDAQLTRLIESAAEIDSNHELFEVLNKLVGRHDLGETSRPAFESAMHKLGDKNHKRLRKKM